MGIGKVRERDKDGDSVFTLDFLLLYYYYYSREQHQKIRGFLTCSLLCFFTLQYLPWFVPVVIISGSLVRFAFSSYFGSNRGACVELSRSKSGS